MGSRRDAAIDSTSVVSAAKWTAPKQVSFPVVNARMACLKGLRDVAPQGDPDFLLD